MTPYDYEYPKERYEERVREADEDHLAARVARANGQSEHRVPFRETISRLRALAAGAGVAALRGRHA